jgi:Protein of unknown function (DUF2934)
MAKTKDRNSTTTTAKKPLQSQRPGKPAPEMPPLRPTDAKAGGNSAAKLSPEEVYRLIQESAYFKAKERGFAPGHEVQDWIEAEAEVRRKLEGRAQQ